ncbi:MAG TPA: glycoside hydrolase family 2 TIM barrel-domain containing protein [Verrucomicrobiae bacterium]|nr:glycoside hydrolase family 2 TIM barrel-domain containing protein [Verrucomicrobiae bacterium]
MMKISLKLRSLNPLPGLACLLAVAGLLLVNSPAHASDWQAVPGKMMTRWGGQVTPGNAWREYPRPQFERKEWKNLNGLWDYAITPKDAAQPTNWQDKILVPYCVESTLSGVGKMLNPDQALWYQDTVNLKPARGQRTLLNFEAVDYQTTVWVNGKQVGEHVGGNTAFTFDITDALKKGVNKIIVRVWDGTDGAQLRGKQTLNPGGIWYTRVSGIWQTVWLEQVSVAHLSDVKLSTTVKPAVISIRPEIVGADGGKIRVSASFGGKTVATTEGDGQINLAIPDAKLWSPAHPNIYDLKIELLDAKGKVLDSVKSYAGIREISEKRDADGNLRFALNGEELFCWGPLDQGWWPDGLLTPPSDAAMCSDIDFLKAAGFNMIRKHIKVEPRRYYAHCDRVGILLWQDQVSGGSGKSRGGQELSPRWTHMQPDPQDATWSDADHAEWMKEFKAMVDELHNQPCIIVWTAFNEAWGQHRTMEVGKWITDYDPTRLVNIASGGNFWPVGNIADNHKYPDPGFPFAQERLKDYIRVVGEFGGHGWPVQGHLWNPDMRNWGYGGLPKTQDEYVQRYVKSLDVLTNLEAQGISAGVYTQTTDVEGELNGLMTYDRAVVKIPAAKLAELHQRLGPQIKR